MAHFTRNAHDTKLRGNKRQNSNFDALHREVQETAQDNNHEDDDADLDAEPYLSYYLSKESFLSGQSLPSGESQLSHEEPSDLEMSGQVDEDYETNERNKTSGASEKNDMTKATMNGTDNIDDDRHCDVEMTVDVQFDGVASGITEGAFVSFKYDGVGAVGIPLSPKISLNI
jgi:hypothetical protein